MLDPAPTDTGRAPADEPATRPAVRIAVAQRVPPRYGDPPALRRLATAATDANGADLLLVPELYPAGFRLDTDELAELAEARETFVEHLGAVARTHRMAIVAGYPERGTDGAVYSSAMFVDADGTELAHYRKLHLFGDETAAFGRGHQVPPVCRWRGWGVGLALCYDIEFPELARRVAELGTEIIFVPSCTDDRQGFLRVRYCCHARAIENQVYVVMTSTVGNLPAEGLRLHYGQAAIITPSDFPFARDGIAAEGVINEEQIVVADVDLHLLDENRLKGTTIPLLDKRSDFYSLTAPVIVDVRGAAGKQEAEVASAPASASV